MFSGTGSSKTALRREDTGRGPRAYQEDLRDRAGQNPGSDALQTRQQGHIVLQDRRRPLRTTRAQGHHGRCTDAYHGGRIADKDTRREGPENRAPFACAPSMGALLRVEVPSQAGHGK